MLTGDRPRNESLNEAFPLFASGEYDFTLPNAHWQIGLSSPLPASLKKKIAAAVASEFLELKSVDYVRHSYLKDIEYAEGNELRLDIKIRDFIRGSMKDFSERITSLSNRAEFNSIGMAVGIWTLGRAHFSIEFLAYASQRGALFEGLCIARFMLEQLTWASYVFNLDDANRIVQVSASRPISNLKKIDGSAALLYGWLSKHVHWEFGAHKKSMISQGATVGHLYGSSYSKLRFSPLC